MSSYRDSSLVFFGTGHDIVDGTVCAKREFMYMYDLACRGEQLLTVLRKQLDPICVKRLESQTCGTGAGSLTIFDYGNKSVLYRLCDKVQENPVAICLAGDSSFERADCTKPQYAFIISIVCAGTGGASSARQLDVRLLIIPLCTCIFIVVSSSMLLPRLSEAECKIHGVFH